LLINIIVQVDTSTDPVYNNKSFDDVRKYLFDEAKRIYEDGIELIDVVVAAQEKEESGGTSLNIG